MDPAANQTGDETRDPPTGTPRKAKLELDPDTILWDRQPGEGIQPYSMFCVYRDLGPDRTLLAAAHVVGRRAKSLFLWMQRNHWAERCAAFDEHNDKQAQKERAVEIREMSKRHAQAAQALLTRAVGRILTLQPNEIRAADIAKMLDVAVKSERLSRGVETEIHRVENAPPRAPVDLSKLTDAELDNLGQLAAKVQSGT